MYYWLKIDERKRTVWNFLIADIWPRSVNHIQVLIAKESHKKDIYRHSAVMRLRNLSFIFLNESKLKYFQLKINMDKPQIVCCAMFSNKDQGIKISYWSFLLKILSLHCISNIVIIFIVNFIQNIKFWGIEVLWVQMTESELTRWKWMLKLLMVQNLLLLFKCTGLVSI